MFLRGSALRRSNPEFSETPATTNLLLDLKDLDLDLAAGGLRFDHIADSVLHERASNGGFVGDLAVTRIGFLGSDNGKDLGVKVLFLNGDLRAHRDHIAVRFFDN